MIKWYENIAKELDIPLIMVDIPFNPDYEVSDAQLAYVKGQFISAIHQLEELTGKKWDEEKYREVMDYSGRSSRAWLRATATARYKPSPFNGFDLLNHMAVMVTARGMKEAAEAMEALDKEYEENHTTGKSTYSGVEKHRIMFEGIACWPWLRVTSEGLKKRGVNMVTTIYADAYGFIYDDFDGMCRAYCRVPNSISLELSRDKRIKICKDTHVEGILVHTNRSCKQWSGFMHEMNRQISEECGIPVSSFDGDQADARNFSEAQYETRVQALTEIMAANKEAR
jgi:benzoyl-CoA reductase/2-hydroxyglutaryl-CoA dehydratase subunit BcrC/BadD/HgdB